MTQHLSLEELQQFSGTEDWYTHPIYRNVVYTEGVKYLAERAGAYWLIDEIAIIQPYEANLKDVNFQLWRLRVRGDRTCQLRCEDGNGLLIYKKDISFTDFPLPEIILFLCDGVILLLSEY